MLHVSMKVWTVAFGSLALAAGSLGVALEGCSSSGNTANETTTGDSGGTKTGGDTGTQVSTACSAADDILSIAFSPMYSAVIPGSNVHTFAVPAIVAGVTPSAVVWHASSDAVVLSADPSTSGILITMNPTAMEAGGAGLQVTITANTVSGACAESILSITQATIDDWNTGNSRYNDASVPFTSAFGGGAPPDGGFRYACTACHAAKGGDAGAGAGFNDVAHTPEQTGGFSDDQLLGIIQDGVVPGYSDAGVASSDAGYFDPTIVSYHGWHHFHRWGLTSAEQKGIVVYLRSLTPTAQNGTSNFGGNMAGDGGFHHHHFDGGSPPPSDASAHKGGG